MIRFFRAPALRLLAGLLALSGLAGCNPAVLRGEVHETGLIACTAPDAVDLAGKPVGCESSAIAVVGDRLLAANDKAPVAGPLVSVPVSGLSGRIAHESVRVESPAWAAGIRKIEDMAPLHGHGRTLVTTAFDRTPETGGKDGARYNVLLSVRDASLDDARVIAPGTMDGVTTSMPLRQVLAAGLADEAFPDGPPYFKIEGLAFVPPDTLMFGFREIGRRFDEPTYLMRILAGRVTFGADGAMVAPDTFLAIDLERPRGSLDGVGLSALAWDPYRRGTWVAASLERAEGAPLRSEVHFLPDRHRDRGRLKPLRGPRGRDPLVIPHKVEGLVVLDRHTLLAICDEDRTPSPVVIDGVETKRRMHEGVFVKIRVR